MEKIIVTPNGTEFIINTPQEELNEFMGPVPYTD
jgi:hypothetical protein